MPEASEHNRKELVYMIQKIMNFRPPLTHIDFCVLFRSKEEAEQGEQILQAIVSITQPTLSYLDLGYNNLMWKDNAKFDMLLDVLQ